MIGANIVYNSINKHAKVPLFIVTTPVPNLSALSEWIQPTRCFLFWTFRPVTQVFTYSTYSYPQEWAAASRDECLCHPHPPQCAFGDIGQFLQPALQATLKDLKGGELLQSKLKPLVEKGLAVKPPLVIHVRIRLLAFLASSSINNQSLLIIFNDRIIHWSMVAMIVVALRNHDSESMESLPWVWNPKSNIKIKVGPSGPYICSQLRKAFCLVHGHECDITESGVANIHCAGTPCTAYSPIGLMDKETAISFAYFLTWIGLRLASQEPIVIQECTDTFPRSEFVDLLPMYDWCFHVICPSGFGWPVRRHRQWAV